MPGKTWFFEGIDKKVPSKVPPKYFVSTGLDVDAVKDSACFGMGRVVDRSIGVIEKAWPAIEGLPAFTTSANDPDELKLK
jgi:hypothetical protein